MRLNVSAWSIRRPVPSIVLFLILTALGVMAFRGLPVERFPNIDFPLISVTVTQAGRLPVRAGNPGVAPCRGRRRRRGWREAHDLGAHRWRLHHDHRIPA